MSAAISIRELQALAFRSYQLLEVSFHPGLNAIVGTNGQGKTNILDMLYMLSMCKAPTRVPDASAIRHGEEGFALHGKYTDPAGHTATVSLGIKRNQGKTLRYDDQPCARLSDHIGRIPLMAIYPHDVELVWDGGELRRRFLNAFIAQFDPAYIQQLAAYEKILSQRNTLLRTPPHDFSLLEVYDMQLAQTAVPVYQARLAACQALSPLLSEYYARLSPATERASITYLSVLSDGDLIPRLQEARPKDLQRMFTTVGIHRDNIRFELNRHALRNMGSQGQQKTFIVALRLAQYHLLRERLGYAPILLLDDLFDKLDAHRVGQLAEVFSGEHFGQVFITDTDPSRIRPLFRHRAGEGRLLEASNGQLNEQAL